LISIPLGDTINPLFSAVGMALGHIATPERVLVE
jgi:hypothetical protein